jgi:hypothetical protein
MVSEHRIFYFYGMRNSCSTSDPVCSVPTAAGHLRSVAGQSPSPVPVSLAPSRRRTTASRGHLLRPARLDLLVRPRRSTTRRTSSLPPATSRCWSGTSPTHPRAPPTARPPSSTSPPSTASRATATCPGRRPQLRRLLRCCLDLASPGSIGIDRSLSSNFPFQPSSVDFLGDSVHAPVVRSGLPSLLGACPPTPCMLARRSSSTFVASSRGYDRPSPTPSTSACRSSSTFAASSRGYDRLSPTPSMSAHRSSSTFAASSRGYDCLSPTPSTSAHRSSSTLVASSRGNGRVSPTPSTSARRSTSTLAASLRGSARVLPTLSMLAHRSTPTWRSTSTPLVASVC